MYSFIRAKRTKTRTLEHPPANETLKLSGHGNRDTETKFIVRSNRRSKEELNNGTEWTPAKIIKKEKVKE